MTNEERTHIDLFSGIGGFALAAQWAGFRTVCFVEIDKYCQKVLVKNFLADAVRGRGASQCETGRQVRELSRHRPGDSGTPIIHSDIFDFDGTAYRGADLLTGGFPCQPYSVAGKRRGAADDRAIWPEMFRVIKEARGKELWKRQRFLMNLATVMTRRKCHFILGRLAAARQSKIGVIKTQAKPSAGNRAVNAKRGTR